MKIARSSAALAPPVPLILRHRSFCGPPGRQAILF